MQRIADAGKQKNYHRQLRCSYPLLPGSMCSGQVRWQGGKFQQVSLKLAKKDRREPQWHCIASFDPSKGVVCKV